MAKIVFESTGTRPDGCRLYRLQLDGVTVREGLTIDEVIEFINQSDEDGVRKGVRRRKRHGNDSL